MTDDFKRMWEDGSPLDLSDWEESFCESIYDQLEQGRTLTERQEEVLDKIVDKNREHPRRWC